MPTSENSISSAEVSDEIDRSELKSLGRKLTGLERHLAYQQPVSTEGELQPDEPSDPVMQRNGHVPRGLPNEVRLHVDPNRGWLVPLAVQAEVD